jgi:hypothetical protein
MLLLNNFLFGCNLTLTDDTIIAGLDTWIQVLGAVTMSAALVAIPFVAFQWWEARMERYGLAEWQLKKLQKEQAAALFGTIAPNSYQMRRLSLINQQEKLRLKLREIPYSGPNWIEGRLQKLDTEIHALDEVGMATTFIFAALPKASGTDSWILRSDPDSDQIKKARMIREIPEKTQVMFDDGTDNVVRLSDGSEHFLDKQEYRVIEAMLEERKVRTFLRQFFKYPWNLEMKFPGLKPPEVFFDCIWDAWFNSLLLLGKGLSPANLSELREAQRARLEEYVLSLIQAEALLNQKQGNYHHQIAALGHWLALWQEMDALSRMYPGISLYEMHFNIESHLDQSSVYQEQLRRLWRSRRTRAICMNWAVSMRPLLAVFQGLV